MVKYVQYKMPVYFPKCICHLIVLTEIKVSWRGDHGSAVLIRWLVHLCSWLNVLLGGGAPLKDVGYWGMLLKDIFPTGALPLCSAYQLLCSEYHSFTTPFWHVSALESTSHGMKPLIPWAKINSSSLKLYVSGKPD